MAWHLTYDPQGVAVEYSVWKERCTFDVQPPQTYHSSAAVCCGHDLILTNKHCVTCSQQHCVTIWFITMFICGTTTTKTVLCKISNIYLYILQLTSCMKLNLLDIRIKTRLNISMDVSFWATTKAEMWPATETSRLLEIPFAMLWRISYNGDDCWKDESLSFVIGS